VAVPGTTVREAIDALDAQYPGLKARLVDPEENRLRRNIALVVDGVTSREGLRQKLSENSEVHFVPAISGGACERIAPSPNLC
ncbi:MAG TPA: MoaD/ThiS family protein, partial [Thermoflexales bacterium]|nr:MoaD/ThiS family protein [Thermoflexales bacterium]